MLDKRVVQSTTCDLSPVLKNQKIVCLRVFCNFAIKVIVTFHDSDTLICTHVSYNFFSCAVKSIMK